MSKRKQTPNRRKKLLRKLMRRKSHRQTSRYISENLNANTAWIIDVTSEQKEPDKHDAKALAYALLEQAADNLIAKAERELEGLKGNRTKAATAQRKELRQRIESLEVYKRRLYGIGVPSGLAHPQDQ